MNMLGLLVTVYTMLGKISYSQIPVREKKETMKLILQKWEGVCCSVFMEIKVNMAEN